MLSDGTAHSVLGFTPPLANLGEMRSWGWEITLKWNDQIGDNFRYKMCIRDSHSLEPPMNR